MPQLMMFDDTEPLYVFDVEQLGLTRLQPPCDCLPAAFPAPVQMWSVAVCSQLGGRCPTGLKQHVGYWHLEPHSYF